MSRLSGRGIARRVARYMRQPGASHTATHAYMYVPFPTGGRERDANALPVRNQCATRASYALGCAHLNLRARLHRIKVFCSTRVARSVVRARFARLVAHRFALWSGLRSRGRSCGRSVGFRSVFAACAGLCRGGQRARGARDTIQSLVQAVACAGVAWRVRARGRVPVAVRSSRSPCARRAA